MIKPKHLEKGDKIAAISLSWGGAGEFRHRYEAGKRQLQETFGVSVVETKHALKPADFIYRNPGARADDLMDAFSDKSVKAIISNIGGEDSIRILPYVDIDVIKANPKIFLGSSDDTITNFLCYKSGLTSFYGTSIMVGFAENGGMHEYQVNDISQTLFSTKPVGKIFPSYSYTSEFLDWSNQDNQSVRRAMTNNDGWNYLQGKGIARGRLIGGCIEVLEFLKGTDLWPEQNHWDNKILFLEPSEEMISPVCFRRILRNYAAQGIFDRISGIMLGRPLHNRYAEEYNDTLLQVIKEEQGHEELTIVTGMDFGHTSPVFTIPYGVSAEIDNEQRLFSITESGVTE